MTTLATPVARTTPWAVLLAIAAAWALAVVAEVTGAADALHHDSLVEGGPPVWAALLVFLIAWQAMVAAMMLPSSLPLIRLYDAVSARQERSGRALTAFLAGYAVVWTAFGALAFLGDVVVHRAVDSVPWLAAQPWLIGGSVLILAGAFQFSELKDSCLSKCRMPGPYLLSHYRRGPAAGFRLGAGHGLYCLGCCWALMLVMFATGVGSLVWMVGLTALMALEKTSRYGPRMVVPVGVALVVAGGTLCTATLA